MSGRQVLVDAEALAKVLMLLPHDAISHLPDEARAAQSLRNALTQPQPALERPTQAELAAVRGYLMDIRAGSHTVGNMRHLAKRYEYGDPSDIPESWKDLPDKAHVTKAMHAEVLWRAFRRAALATQPQPEP